MRPMTRTAIARTFSALGSVIALSGVIVAGAQSGIAVTIANPSDAPAVLTSLTASETYFIDAVTVRNTSNQIITGIAVGAEVTVEGNTSLVKTNVVSVAINPGNSTTVHVRMAPVADIAKSGAEGVVRGGLIDVRFRAGANWTYDLDKNAGFASRP